MYFITNKRRKEMFKKGDKVIVNGAYGKTFRSAEGIILGDKRGLSYLVQFKDHAPNNHNCDGLGEDGYCWWVIGDLIKLKQENGTGFKVGDTVKVVDEGFGYSTYWSFFGEQEIGEILMDNIYKYSGDIEEGIIGTVLYIGEHCHGMDMVAVVQVDNYKDSKDIYLIGVEGLKIIKSKKQKKIEKIEGKILKLTDELITLKGGGNE